MKRPPVIAVVLLSLAMTFPALAAKDDAKPQGRVKMCRMAQDGCDLTYDFDKEPGDGGTHVERVNTTCVKTRGCNVFNTKGQ